ncbi:Dabb family protein [Bradyrhizobium lupini]
MPYARRLEVARNCKSDRLNEIDVIVYGEFDNEGQLEPYKAHEVYQQSIRQVSRCESYVSRATAACLQMRSQYVRQALATGVVS